MRIVSHNRLYSIFHNMALAGDVADRNIVFYDGRADDCVVVEETDDGLQAVMSFIGENNPVVVKVRRNETDTFVKNYIQRSREKGETTPTTKRFLFNVMKDEMVMDLDTPKTLTWFSYIPPKGNDAKYAFDLIKRQVLKFNDSWNLSSLAMAFSLSRAKYIKPETMEAYGSKFAAYLLMDEMNVPYAISHHAPLFDKLMQPGKLGSNLDEHNVEELNKITGKSKEEKDVISSKVQ